MHISITGSRAKGIASANSDYDTKVIVLHPEELYLLQRTAQALNFETDLEGVEVEGTFIDFLRATEWTLETNPMIYEAFEGDVIYTT